MANPFYQLTKIFDQVKSADGGAAVVAILEQEIGLKPREARFYILRLLDECSDAYAHSRLDDNRIDDAMQQVNLFKDRFILNAALKTCAELRSKLQLDNSLTVFNAYGDLVETSLGERLIPIDRKNLREQTDLLIQEVQDSELPSYARTVLLIKLNALSRILLDCGTFPDGEIRRRVKGIYADYCGEFRRHDREHEMMGEKIFRWARNASGVGIFALALTADATAVAGLLEAPRPSLPPP